MEIAGATALVTGASGGLGAAIARELAARGAHVVLTARSQAAIEALASELDGEAVVADLTDRGDVEALCSRLGGVDILVANAGVGGSPPLDEVEADDLDGALDVNLRAPMRLTLAFVRARQDAGRGGHVVLIGSLSGLTATPGTYLYNATKFGLRGFGLALRQDLHGSDIGLSLVEPGFIRDAGMFHNGGIDLPPGTRTRTPDDVATAVARAVVDDRGEVFVAPLELRLGAALGGLAPGFNAAVMRRVNAGERVAAEGDPDGT